LQLGPNQPYGGFERSIVPRVTCLCPPARGVAAAYGPLTGPLGWRFYASWQAVPPARPLGLTGLGSVVPAAQIFGLRVRGLAPPGKLTGRWAKGQFGAGCFTSFVEHERGGTARSTGRAFCCKT